VRLSPVALLGIVVVRHSAHHPDCPDRDRSRNGDRERLQRVANDPRDGFQRDDGGVVDSICRCNSEN